jgi:amino acid adenylation domain-containing protein
MDIAIIGIGIRMPEADTLAQFEANLASGRDSVREISTTRKMNTGLSPRENYQLLGYLEDIDRFDPAFFGISRSEAKNMAPEQRILMEIAYEAFENAGYNYEYFSNSRTAVYIGDTWLQYHELAREIESTLYTGNMNSIMAGRIARFFNLRQKAVMVDTTCSSSLVALHEACCDLACGECDQALVGAVSLNLFPRKRSTVDHLGILSPGGKARAFSAQADGTSAGEAGVCILLKPLEKAVADHDIIHAVIKGTAANQDAGLSGSLTAPSSTAQSEVIIAAWKKAGIDPVAISYIEAHGTGTRLGDPIEIEGIDLAFRKFTDRRHCCAVSAVKSNIGHTDCVAGLAGLVKTVLSLKSRVLFPSLHFNEPNPFIDFKNSAVYINASLRPWEPAKGHSARMAGVSSFGLSGTNCHVVVAEAPAAAGRNNGSTELRGAYPILLSAHTPASLKKNAKALMSHLEAQPMLLPEDISYTLAVGRKHHKYRSVVWAASAEELRSSLQALADASQPVSVPPVKEKKVFIFSDWAIAHTAILQAYSAHPVFMEHYTLCRELAADNIEQAPVCQFAFQYSLGRLLEHAGASMSIMVGGDVGRLVIATLTGKMPLDAALQAAMHADTGQEQGVEERTAALLNKFKGEQVHFVEMGPLGNISNRIAATLQEGDGYQVSALSRADEAIPVSFLAVLFQLQEDLNMQLAWPLKSSQRIELPTYQFDRERCWLEEDLHFDKVKDWCFTFKWVEQELTATATQSAFKELLLVADEDNTLADALHEQLALQHVRCRRLAAESEAEIRTAVSHLNNTGPQQTAILLLADQPLKTYSSLSEQVEDRLAGISRCFNVLNACSHVLAAKGTKVMIVTRYACQVLAEEQADPFRSAYAAMLRGIQSEHPSLTTHFIDLDQPQRQQAAYIVKELQSTGNNIGYCAYRNNKRYVAQLCRASEVKTADEQRMVFGGEGTYLVTGGATGIGLAIIRSLAKQQRCHFIILGRTVLPDKRHWKGILEGKDAMPSVYERIKALVELEQLGAKVEYHDVDVSDRNALQHVVNNIKKRYECIDGVLHAAGLSIEHIPFEQLTPASFQGYLAAKVAGTVWLDEQVQELCPRFFVLFSSLNAWVPRKHSTAYAVANAFEDAYALSRSAGGTTSYLSINWPGWDLKEEEIQQLNSDTFTAGLYPISSKGGVTAFYYALQLDNPNITIVPADPAGFAINPFFLIEQGEQTSVPVTAAPLPSLTATEGKMLTIWREVLKSDNIGIEDDFFEVGGHSLVGIQIVNRIERELCISIDFELFFDYYTVKDLSAYIDSLKPADTPAAFEPLQPVEEQEYYTVSFAQKRLWVMNFLVDGNVYNIPTAYILKGRLDITALEAAFDTLISRHESLRTVLLTVDGIPKQKVLGPRMSGFRIKFMDLRNDPSRHETASVLMAQMLDIRFDLFKGPIILAQLIRLEEDKFIFGFTLHHIISDGWSSEIIIRELILAYNAYSSQQQPLLPALSIQYKDYTCWQQQQAQKPAFQEHRDYWLRQFAGEIPVLDLPTDKIRPAVQTFRGKTLLFTFDAAIQQKLRKLGVQQDATSFMMLFTILNVLLYRYTRQGEIIVGATVTERGHYELENQVGFYVNTLPLRTSVDPSDTFVDLLDKVKKVVADANKHKDFPLELLIDELNLVRDASRSALFDVMAVYQHTGNPGEQLKMNDIEVDDYHLDTDISRFDLTFDFYESDNDIILKLVFNSALYTEQFANRMGNHLRQILLSCLDNPQLKIDGIQVADAAEEAKLLSHVREAQLTCQVYEPNKTLVEQWENTVRAYKERTALYFEDQTWSYQALNAISNQLAHHLRAACGITPDDRVALLLDKSAHTIISILAVLKAGAAYLPVEPAHPVERIRHMLKDASPKAVITHADHLTKLEEYEGHVFVADLELDRLRTEEQDPVRVNRGSDLACCIYTSGSTGVPKAALVEHYSLLSLIEGLNSLLQLSSDTPIRMAVIAPVVFDPFGKQLFLALLNGHTLYVVPDAVKRSGVGLWNYYMQYWIDLTDGTPSFLQLLVSCCPGGKLPVRYWLIGGETLSSKTVLSLYGCYPPEQDTPVLINEYGLTECSVDNCCYKVNMADIVDNGILPIGRPLLHNNIFLLDEHLQPVPEGATGEICIAGAGVGRGYMNQPELTHEKFLSVPSLYGLKVFRTGDLGRWLASNELLCLGRKDRQVKIRANRIELGEIEQALIKHQYIKEVYVADRQNAQNERYLVAYLIVKQTLTHQEVKDYLQTSLPDYMVPSYIVILDHLPLTLNGKVDKDKLPDPAKMQIPQDNYVAPTSEMEQMLCEIWAEVLLKDRVSIKDDFFMLGGDSIKAIQISFRLNKAGYKVTVKDILYHSVLEELALLVNPLAQNTSYEQ